MSSNTRLIVLFSITRYLHFYADYTQALSFSIDRFDPGANNIIYEGDATPSVGAIEMNLAEWLCRVGRATYAEPLHLWDSSNRTLTDFTTNFSFTIDTLNADKYGHGIAFFLSSVGSSIPTNSPGGFLGLFNTTTSAAASRNQLVAVEFDTFVNEEWDPPVQHVGINNNSIASAVYAKWDPGSYSGKTAKVGISYNATTKNLSVLWTYDENLVFTGNNSLSYLIDLMELLPEWVSFGFSASTGQYVERNTINSWAFSSNLGAKVASHKKGKLKTVWIALIAVAGAGVCFLVLLFLLNKFCTTVPVSRRPWPINFSYGDLADATNNFADDRKLGKGVSGTVFEGFLRDLGCQVAVKKIDAESEDLFINEVNIISSLKHRNLVKFMGWCHEQGKFLLVYEYMSKGSLHDHLFGNRKILRWNVRYNTALALAAALKYLHEDVDPLVLHMDIKPDNILLGEDFRAKVGDFGISKFVHSQLRSERTNPVGTRGYVAPEFRREGRATTHSDMYSFGVVALEIACGKMNYRNNDPQNLIKEVWTLYKAEKILDAADKKLKKEFDPKEMECLMIVGLLCTNPADNGRPSAGRVMQYLNSPELPLPELPPLLHDPEFPVNLDAGERITQ
ncbi:hypothetical protein P3X46_004280 [Hevea brasiliensis]|uniref:non-specific serine/threonine protein kinase n=1 Tax=Hevea brasiliensis TaxID=3981 RepID=A0ABQ9MZ43_HEVBR|nr:L-type lectin-domain containing receptor kinase IX.1-like [Hevea brasiliensis]KAJ9184566.1 hypothetical protein P3X46_004280 [Hevea brasiliensis]